MSVHHFNKGETSMFLKAIMGESNVTLQPTQKELELLIRALDKGVEYSSHQTRAEIKRWVESAMSCFEILRHVLLGSKILRFSLESGECALSLKDDYGQFTTKTLKF